VPSREIPVYRYDSVGIPGNVNHLTLSPDAKALAAGTSTGSGFSETNTILAGVRILNLQDGRILGAPLDGKKRGAPGGLQFSSDGSYVITGHGGTGYHGWGARFIEIIDAKTYQVVDSVKSGGDIWDISSNPRSSEFAAGVDKSIVIWKIERQ
jgi:hypothetical protein